jgi:integrase
LVYWQDGRRKRKAFYAKTKEEAARKLRVAQAALDQGTAPPREDLSVETHLRTWMEARQPNLRPETARRYADLIERWLIPALGRRKLARAGISDILAMHKTCGLRGSAGPPSTTRTALRAASTTP